MSSYKFKTFALMFIAVGVSSCGIFSNDKELPSGTRISILTEQNTQNAQTSVISGDSFPTPIINRQWTQIGGNASHTGTDIHTSNDLKLLWHKNFGDGASKKNLLLAQPVVYNNIVYTQDVNATVYAFSLNDGKKIWKQKLKPLTENELESGLNGVGLAIDNQALYAVAGYGSVFALNRENGDVLWRKNIGSPLRAAPTICDNKIIIQTLDNRLLAFNTQSGEEIWKYNVPAEDTVLAGGPAPACLSEKNLVVAGFSNGEIHAFNADIGYPLWSTVLINNGHVNLATDINAIKAPPVIDDNTVYAIGHNDLLAAIDYRTGDNKWEQKIGGINLPWVVGDYIFVLSNNNELLALNKKSGKVLWQTSLLTEYPLEERSNIYLTGPIMINKNLLVTASNGIVYEISSTDGQIIHRRDLEEPLPLAPISAGSAVVFITNDADLLVYK